MAEGRYDLFLSYRREDGEVVTALASYLRECGVNVWLDRWNLIPGQNLMLEVERVISAASAIAICVGKGGIEGWLHIELSQARSNGLRLIPVLLPTANGIPLELEGLVSVDLRSEDEENLATSLNQLVALFVKRETRADTTPNPATTLPPAAKGLFESLAGLFRTSRTGAAATIPAQPAPAAAKVEEKPTPTTQTAADPRANVTAARNILRGQSASVEDIAKLVKGLKAEKHFGYARQLLARLRANPSAIPPQLRLYLAQQHALCTYKDPHLPADIRYDSALKILGEADDMLSTENQETLGLAGAICKYKWEVFGQRADLERSATYYRRGYKQGVLKDYGYTAINAAYVLDLLAFQDSEQAAKAGDASESAEQSRKVARKIREELVSKLPPLLSGPDRDQVSNNWWFLVTVAEAYFGLQDYDEARQWIASARETQPEDWQLESTLRQFASVARLHASALQLSDDELEKWPSWHVLVAIAGGDKASGVRTALIGKVGLALSGGGFRASLYHIGVLAKLAELDVLRHVEVISCVSGGSIVGTHYYLELQELLETKGDAEISREDYIAIVRRMQRAFLDGVQTNIRMRVIANIVVNLKMVFWPGYSRTERAGELYEEKIFSRAGDGKRSRKMSDLMVRPAGQGEDFRPATHNWLRRAKVPVLVLNATSLNTGHNWQFTATWMGEPTKGIDSEVDGNYRLRRMYYTEAPERYRHYPLGQAVAASACVPGLFEPIGLPKLYLNIDVRLVDGGVQDNQGIGAMLDEDCTVLLISDGSGQMGAQNRPGNGAVSALLRSNSILGSRVREAEFRDVAARRRSSLLRGLMFIHLKKGLDVRPVDWIDCEDPAEVLPPAPLTPYGIRKDVQELLAGIRTDLDSFNDVEAYALMTSGYRMAEYEFARTISGFPRASPATIDWQFLAVERPMKEIRGSDGGHKELKALLEAANCMAFKVWRLSAVLRITGWILILLGVAGLVYEAFWGSDLSLVTSRMLITAALAAAVGSIFGKNLVRVVRFQDTLRQIAVGIALCIAGWLIGGLHLLVFDRMYLRRGRIDIFLQKMSGVAGPARD